MLSLRRMRSSRGMSLIEGVLAMFLLFVAISMVFGVFPGAHRATDLAFKYSLARELARETLAVERSKAFSAVTSVPRHPVPTSLVRNGVPVNVVLWLTVNVRPTSGLKELLVEVDWEGSHRLQMETLLVDR